MKPVMVGRRKNMQGRLNTTASDTAMSVSVDIALWKMNQIRHPTFRIRMTAIAELDRKMWQALR